MIERYTRPQMGRIWTDRNRYLAWLRVELAVCEELAKDRLIPRKEWLELKKKLQNLIARGGVDPKRVNELEKTVRHDVIAFTTAIAEKIGPTSRYVHYGLTSSDVVDTALSLLIRDAGEVLLEDVRSFLETLKSKAIKYRDLPTIGRSHGIYAEPTSFGLKFLGWYKEWQRNLTRLERSLNSIQVGKLSGAVGVNAHWSPDFEGRVLKRLKLRRESVSTQVIARDHHAELLGVFAICGSSLERMAVELRHLQRTEVGEVMEGFRKGQKGSSAMPHKRNPISSENLSGCARLLRAYAQTGLENITLWHERDISHSSVERISFPDSTILLDYALDRMNRVLRELVVKKDRVRVNLEKAGPTVFSGHYLLELVRAGASREDAYRWIQDCAVKDLDGKGSFTKLLGKHQEVRKFLSSAEVKKLGSIKYQLRNVKAIYQEAFRKSASH